MMRFDVSIQTEDFDLSTEIESLRKGDKSVGAVCSLVGTVRDRNDGDSVSSLELEHYPGMTEASICKMIDEALHIKGSVFGKLLQLGAEFVFQDAAGHAQLLEVGEVAQQRHIGISWVVGTHGLVVVPGLLSCCHQAQVGAQQHTLEVSAWR